MSLNEAAIRIPTNHRLAVDARLAADERRSVVARNPLGAYISAGLVSYLGDTMSVDQAIVDRHQTDYELGRGVRRGALLMALAGVAFIGYGAVFLARTFFGTGFELGVATLNGVTRADLNALNPAVVHYINHLHVATAAFIISTGIAVAALAWYGVRSGLLWAWTTAVVAAVVGLGLALPMHYADLFTHNWVTHLGPIYLATIVFVVGAALAYRGLQSKLHPAEPDENTGV